MKRQTNFNYNVYHGRVLCGLHYFLAAIAKRCGINYTMSGHASKKSKQFHKFATGRTKGTVGINATHQTRNKRF